MVTAAHRVQGAAPARRVLMVDSESTWRGGEGQLLLLMRGLRERGFEVVLAAPPASAIAAKAGGLGVGTVTLPVANGMDLAAVWRLRSVLREQRYDIVHCHSSHAHSIAFMASYALAPRSRDRRPPLVISRRVDFKVARNRFSGLKYRYGADIFLAISNGVRDVLIEGGVGPDRIRLVPSGIDLDKFHKNKDPEYIKKEFGIDADTKIIGNVAALAPHKSQVDFIRAAKLIRDDIDNARFFVVGEGELRPRLEALIRELGMEDRIVLTGFREDVLEILSTFDCFVLSSYLEGLCTSIMDAQALGVPVVATATGGVPDLVEDRKTGLLVEPRRPDLLAAAVLEMLGNAKLRQSCVTAARDKARTYDYRNMVERTVSAYEDLFAGSQRAGEL